MHALVDLDIVTYETASATDEESNPLPWSIIKSRLNARIEGILSAVKAESWQGYLTGKNNFRDKVATILPYKGPRRLKERPFWYDEIRDYLISQRMAILVDGMEADDAIAIASSTDGTIVCSKDKDFRQLPGWIHSWSHKPDHPGLIEYIEPVLGSRNFYAQLLTGDASDNILGLYGVGSSSKLLSNIHAMDDELDMLAYVKEQYEKRFGSYWYKFLEENGTLLWLLRTPDDEYKTRLHDNLLRMGSVQSPQ